MGWGGSEKQTLGFPTGVPTASELLYVGTVRWLRCESIMRNPLPHSASAGWGGVMYAQRANGHHYRIRANVEQLRR